VTRNLINTARTWITGFSLSWQDLQQLEPWAF